MKLAVSDPSREERLPLLFLLVACWGFHSTKSTIGGSGVFSSHQWLRLSLHSEDLKSSIQSCADQINFVLKPISGGSTPWGGCIQLRYPRHVVLLKIIRCSNERFDLYGNRQCFVRRRGVFWCRDQELNFNSAVSSSGMEFPSNPFEHRPERGRKKNFEIPSKHLAKRTPNQAFHFNGPYLIAPLPSGGECLLGV